MKIVLTSTFTLIVCVVGFAIGTRFLAGNYRTVAILGLIGILSGALYVVLFRRWLEKLLGENVAEMIGPISIYFVYRVVVRFDSVAIPLPSSHSDPILHEIYFFIFFGEAVVFFLSAIAFFKYILGSATKT